MSVPEISSHTNAFTPMLSSAFGGSIGGFTMFPFEGLKKRVQTGQKISFLPRELFRGSSAFANSVMVATVSSNAFRLLLQNLPAYDGSLQSHQAITAIGGGVIGAFFGSTPVENIILTQQLNKTGPIQACKIMLLQGGIRRPWVGLPELAMREAGFSAVMWWAGRAARETVYEKTQNKRIAEIAEFNICALGAVVTHPFDTMATKKQKSNGTLSTREVFNAIYKSNGAKGFFAGVQWRIFLFTGCAVIIPRIQTSIKQVLDAHL